MPIIRRTRGLLVAAALACGLGSGFGFASTAAAAAPTVVASIAPVHSLVAAVMDGVGEPRLLVPGNSSPHSWALRPSDARAIEAAALLVWVGPGLENFLVRPLASLAPRATSLRLIETEGLRRLPLRDGHGHDDGHDDGHGGNDHGGGHGSDAGAGIDMHVWLDPRNARLMAVRIAETLAVVDPAHADTYRANAAALQLRLAELDERIARQLAPLAGRGFVVFHDGFQYFEKRYGLALAGALTVNPEVSSGADRVRRIRERIAADGVACVFIEPQFPAAIAEALVEGTGARIGRLDPLGAGIAPGPELYPRLVQAMADAFHDCLAPPGAAAGQARPGR